MGLTMGLCPGSHAVSLFFYQGHGSRNRNIGPDLTRQHFGCKTGGIQTKPRLSRVVSKTSMTWWSIGLCPSRSMIFSQHSCRLLLVLKERHPQSGLTNIAPLNCAQIYSSQVLAQYICSTLYIFFFLLLFPLMLFTTQSIHQEMKHLLVKDSICSLVFLRKFMLEMQPEVELEAIPDC